MKVCARSGGVGIPMGVLKTALLSQWRELRWVLLAAACSSILCLLVFYLAWPRPRAVDIDFRVLKFFLLVLWSTAGASAGALTFSEDSENRAGAGCGKRRLGILLFRAFAGFATLLAAAVILVPVPFALYLGGWDFYGGSSLFILEFADFDILLLFGFLLPLGAGSFISSRNHCLAQSIICSTVISILLLIGVTFFWLRVDLHEFENAKIPWILSAISVSAVLLFAASVSLPARKTGGLKAAPVPSGMFR